MTEHNDLPFSNSTRGDDTIDAIVRTAEDGIRLLEPHCGPNATYVARAISGQHIQDIDDFTKDGITIARSSSTDNPEQEFVRRMLVFVGSSVDRVCHDGTTTAMMFTAALICEYLKLVKGRTRRERRKLSLAMEAMFREMSDHVSSSKITLTSLTEHLNEIGIKLDERKVKEIIAYWTAYTSTKGDKAYARAIADAVMTYPPELYDYGRVGQSTFEEKDTHVSLSGGESDLSVQARTALDEFKGNDALRMDWHFDNALVAHYYKPLVPNDPIADFLTDWVAWLNDPNIFAGQNKPTYVKPDCPVIIFSPKQSDSRLMALVRQYNKRPENSETPILLFSTIGYDPESSNAFTMVLPAISGEGQYRALDQLQHGAVLADCLIPCKFDTLGDNCRFSNLYVKGEGPEHPFLHDESKEAYHQVKDALTAFIRNDRQRHIHVSDITVNQFYYFLQQLLAQDVRNVMSCGTTHEVIAGKSVLEDGLGATISVLQNGFTLSGYVKLYDALRKTYRQRYDAEGKTIDETYVDIYQATITALKRVIAATYDIGVEEIEHYFPDGEHLAPYEGAVEDLEKIVVRRSLQQDVMEPNWEDSAPVVQPILGFEEQLRRNMDLVIKLVRTNTVIRMKG